jgi:hypothetical protein
MLLRRGLFVRYHFVWFARVAGSCAIAAALASCGGSSSSPSPVATATPTPTPSASGDFLNFAPSRGWNYLVTNVQGEFTYSPPTYVATPVTTATVTLYDDPTPVDGTTILLAVATPGQATSALTVATSQQYIFGAAGFSTIGSTYTATRYANYTVTAAIPATTVVSSPLVLGATSTPFAGVTETVTAIGTVPGEAACSTPTTIGATVKYVYGSQSGTVAYVPGCGITQIVDNKGETWTLQSIGSYPAAASNFTISSVAQQVGNANALDTVRSIFGLEQGGPIRHSFAP